MRKPRSGLETPSDDQSPSVSIGGLLSGGESWWLYKPITEDGLDWDMPPRERYLPMPKRGLGDINEMYKSVEEDVLSISQKVGRQVVVVGHSLGAIPAEKMALDHPDVATNIVVVAGAHEGQRYETPTSFLLRKALILSRFLKDSKAAEVLRHDSPFMTEHVERVASEWPEDVGLHGISTAFDDLLPFMHGLKLKLPEGQQAEKGVIALPIPGLQGVLRLMMSDNNIKHIASMRPALHIDIIRHPVVVNYVRELQRIEKDNVVELKTRKSFSPLLEPVEAA
jgi:pimeloyl-ACP methyl ester carboxylesterase